MATDKYSYLIKPLSLGATDFSDAPPMIGPGNAKKEFLLNGRNHLEGLDLNFSWGVHEDLGDWHAGMDPHIHPYPEVLLFVGLDTANVNYLGASIDCCLGREQEICSFDEPTAIVVPAGLPHGPINTKRMYSPKGFGFWAVELRSTSDITWLGEGVAGLTDEQKKALPEGLRFVPEEKALRNKPIPATGKYAHLVKPLKSSVLVERRKLNPAAFTPEQFADIEERSGKTGEKAGPGYPDHMVYMPGRELAGLNASIFWGFCSGSGLWRRGAGAHVHSTDEILVFLGLDPRDDDHLGAEVEIEMGPEHERHRIDKPSVVVCPAGLPHTPMVTQWVDRPFAFFAVNLSDEHEIRAVD
jgi:hypothetical protein